MYQPTIPVLWSDVSREAGFRSGLTHMYSNGTYVRHSDGHLICRKSYKDQGIFIVGECNGERIVGQITDKLLVGRIQCYWDSYFEAYYTNCSAFAHYLTTGEFVECEEELGLLVIRQGMRPYEMADRVDVGDMVCILYGRDRLVGSRRHKYAHRYRKAKKHRHDRGGFGGASTMRLEQRPFMPDEIRGLHANLLMGDFHFMVCVAKKDGKPIWLSQSGRVPPGDGSTTFSITYGDGDPYLSNVPVFAFIKKRR